jgi:hypothetical protein
MDKLWERISLPCLLEFGLMMPVRAFEILYCHPCFPEDRIVRVIHASPLLLVREPKVERRDKQWLVTRLQDITRCIVSRKNSHPTRLWYELRNMLPDGPAQTSESPVDSSEDHETLNEASVHDIEKERDEFWDRLCNEVVLLLTHYDQQTVHIWKRNNIGSVTVMKPHPASLTPLWERERGMLPLLNPCE